MEGSSNPTKRKGDDVQDGLTSSGKKLQNINVGMEFFGCRICSKTLRPPIYQLPFEYCGSMMTCICESCRNKLPESEIADSFRSNTMERWLPNAIIVATGMEVFDCSICSKPLAPPIFQSSKGNSICSPCHENLPEGERAGTQRSYIMERVVNNIFVPCKYGCYMLPTYYGKDIHAKQCILGPGICPVTGCDFLAPVTPLLDHLTSLHNLPGTPIDFFEPLDIPVQTGSQVLHSEFNCLFLLDVVALESFGHAIYLVCVRPETPTETVEVIVELSRFGRQVHFSKLEITPEDTPRQYLCAVPLAEPDAVISIELRMLYIRNDGLLEEEDDDEDYKDDDDEEEDD
ncbi:hypothetical protein QYE76_049184 [Lolium multiflorum]|uniref:SIAH-type domain-containing protein n=1 Tax=Lolium multiflorum TaxID=4521 RepID=A0AAD8SNE4_LOLMU|nr:hypothetical protein QYE76_049184 [Lolium multiflorum]